MKEMIPYNGHCSVKQYVKNEARPSGLENFVIWALSGSVIDLEIYQD